MTMNLSESDECVYMIGPAKVEGVILAFFWLALTDETAQAFRK